MGGENNESVPVISGRRAQGAPGERGERRKFWKRKLEISECCNRIWEYDKNRVQSKGCCNDLYAHAFNDFIAVFFSGNDVNRGFSQSACLCLLASTIQQIIESLLLLLLM